MDGVGATGWGTNVECTEQNIEELVSELATCLGSDNQTARQVLAKSHLIVESEPIDVGVALIESHTALPGAAARLCMQKLREMAGNAADANCLAKPENPSVLTASDVQSAVDAVTATVDPMGYFSLTSGLCEIANFGEAVSSAGFYSGVDVLPGHVGAGLVFARPEAVSELLDALHSGQLALIAGPSGSGKSALAWLAAYETRHEIRWYRVRQLRREDVTKLAQTARLLDASPTRPIGFVVDDVGRESTAGWDNFVTEARAISGVFLIGTIREEDIFTLSTAATIRTIRPILDEDLAQRIWSALAAAAEAKAAYWREAFEESQQLLLEFTHLLTQGERLADTIKEQMRRRLFEHRDDEIEILRPVAFAAANGAAIMESSLVSRLAWDSARFARAIHRLENEHALRRRPDGTLVGLHEIRSIYIDNALRESLNEPVRVALEQALADIQVADLQSLIVRTLRRWPDQNQNLLNSLSRRLSQNEPKALAGALHGLGLATCDMIAEEWLKITRELEIEDRITPTLLLLGLGNAKLDAVPQFAKVAQAHVNFLKVRIDDLRSEIASQFVPTYQTANLDDFHELLAALIPLQSAAGRIALPSSTVVNLHQQPLIPTLEILRTAYECSSTWALDLAAAAGGAPNLLERLFNEVPWITRPTLLQDGEETIAASNVRFVSEGIQPDIHADVVRLCELLLAAAPSATIAVSRAVFADGTAAGLTNHPIADKRIPRSNLAVEARVSWNRALLRAVQRLIGGKSETERTAALANALVDLAKMVNQAGELYCRGESPGERWQLLLQIRRYMTALVPPPKVDKLVPNALAKGDYDGTDGIFDLATGLEQLSAELTGKTLDNPLFAAIRAIEHVQKAEALSRADVWRLVDTPPLESLAEIRDTLLDIRAVLGEVAVDPDYHRRITIELGRRSRKHASLPKAAAGARDRADRRTVERRNAIEAAFSEVGEKVQVFSRNKPKDSGYHWPDVEFAVLVESQTIFDWFSRLEQISNVITGFESIRLAIAPLIGNVVAPIAMTHIISILPYPKFAADWREHIPFDIVSDEVIATYDQALDTATTISAATVPVGRELIPEERAFVETLLSRISEDMAYFSDLMRQAPDEDLIGAVRFLAACIERALREMDGNASGERLAAVAHSALSSASPNDFTIGVLTARLTLIDRALNRVRRTNSSSPLQEV